MRTTIDIDDSVLRQAKERARAERKSLARTVSELLAVGLAQTDKPAKREFRWHSQDMGAKINIEDKDAVWAVLDGDYLT